LETLSLADIEDRIHDLEAFDNGNCGELPLFPEEVAELASLRAIRNSMIKVAA
jgi:hypothetical protein